MRRSRRRERHWAEHSQARSRLPIEGGEPLVEQVAGGAVRDVAHLVAGARKANDDGGMNGADVVSGAGGHRSVGGIAEDDGVDLIWIVIVFRAGSCGGPGSSAGGTISAGVGGGEMGIPGVTQGIEDGEERTDGGHDREQDGCGAERLAASDIEGGSGECGDASGRLMSEGMFLGFSRREPSRGRSGGVGHIDSLDAGFRGLRRRAPSALSRAAHFASRVVESEGFSSDRRLWMVL